MSKPRQPPSARRADATLAQVKALADPLRYRVFEALLNEPRTAKQMAAQLGTRPTRLYHHFRVLERAGLIRPAGTRQTRGTTEKYFAATADRIQVTGAASGISSGLVAALYSGVLESTLSDMRRAARARAPKAPSAIRPYLKRYVIRATPAAAAGIRRRLDALSMACERAATQGGTTEFAVTLTLHETSRPTDRKRRS
jgi:DNA-binding transcriptional ArsR family regulator